VKREDAQRQADLLVGERDEHQPAGRRREREGEAHHRGDAGRVDDHRHAVAARPLAHLVGQAGRVPADDVLGAHRLGVLQALGHPVGQQHRGALVVGGETDRLADRAGAEDDDALAVGHPRAGHRVHADRRRLDECGHRRRQVAHGEDLRCRHAQALLQGAVDVGADDREVGARVPAPDAARVAGAAGQHRPHRDAIARAHAIDARADGLDHRRDLVPLDARQGVAEPPVEEMDVRAADADDLGAQHDLPRGGLARPLALQKVHRPLARRDRRPHGRDPTF
jgi:hypothetical protein